MTVTEDKPVEIITPVGQIGYGYPIDPFLEECRRMPEGSFIIADCGSTDSGPQKLCFGLLTAPRESYLRDMRPIFAMAHERGFKVLFGSAGGHGSNSHVDEFADIVNQICKEEGYSFKVAKIYAEIDKDLIKSHIANGTCTPCGPVPELTDEEVEKCPRVVAQMGCEPFIKALEGGADIVLGGRAYDPAPYAAVCNMAGIDPGLGWHMGKIVECGALCATPRGKSIRATIRKDSFDLTPVNTSERCIPISVAAHTLYEKSRPDLLPGPGGILDLNNCTYTAVSDRTTRVSGAVFKPQPYTVKLEGAKPLGFRAIVVAGMKDPILIRQIDAWLEIVRKTVMAMMDNFDPEIDRLAWHVYGKNGVMGELEPDKDALSHELLIMAETLSSTQDRAKQIGNRLRIALLHTPYPGQMANSGNVAFPYAPFETPLGPFCEFNVYHIIPTDDALALFPVEYLDISYSAPASNGANVDPYSAVAKEVAAYSQSGKPKPTFKELVAAGRKSAAVSELARFVRSKNAGPYEVTFDVMFAEDLEYEWVKQTGVFKAATLAKMYNTKPENVVTCMFFDPARAFKFTIPRPRVEGGFGETDMHAAQEYMPIARLQIPLPDHL
ncbi:hypothetical protein M231_05389 [Tremella mesenterica]|uniref:3-methylaspartate ammonia-lyase n=1 Tax=Tremella mesenterica TaxID=5217 RepID=A0A4Q1BI53_TREME|nr:hypothetical protein M231_05389 [Tremella mesenterica]